MVCAPSEDSDQPGHPLRSAYSPSAWIKLGSLATHCAHSEDSDQTGRMPRLTWVFAGRTCHFVGFVMRRLTRRVTHPPSLIRVFAVRMNKAWVLSYPLSAQRRLVRLGVCPGWTLIKLGVCPGWSGSSLGAHAILLVLSWGGWESESESELFSGDTSERQSFTRTKTRTSP